MSAIGDELLSGAKDLNQCFYLTARCRTFDGDFPDRRIVSIAQKHTFLPDPCKIRFTQHLEGKSLQQSGMLWISQIDIWCAETARSKADARGIRVRRKSSQPSRLGLPIVFNRALSDNRYRH